MRASLLTSTGVFLEIDPPERFVSTERLGMDDQWTPGEAVTTYTFAEQNGKTTPESFHRLDALFSTSSHIR